MIFFTKIILTLNIILYNILSMKTHKLKIYRKEKGMTRKQLKELLGLKSPITIYNWERWNARPRPETAMAVEQLTGGEVSASYMLYG